MGGGEKTKRRDGWNFRFERAIFTARGWSGRMTIAFFRRMAKGIAMKFLWRSEGLGVDF